MAAYLSVSVSFRRYDNDPNIVEDLHELYGRHGLSLKYIYCEENEDISYEKACKANQKCFDELIEFEEWKHYRMSWGCDWISFVDTFPSIEIVLPDYEGAGRPYCIRKEERILFPEDEITDDVFSRILELVTDLYKLNSVHSVTIQKET